MRANDIRCRQHMHYMAHWASPRVNGAARRGVQASSTMTTWVYCCACCACCVCCSWTGPTRTNCLLTAVGRPYPAGCAVPGGVKYEPTAFADLPTARQPRAWRNVSTGLIHAIHSLGCPVMSTAIPWFDWWWRLSHVHLAPPPPPPPPPGPPPPPPQCGALQVIPGGCCGGENVRCSTMLHVLALFCAQACSLGFLVENECSLDVCRSAQHGRYLHTTPRCVQHSAAPIHSVVLPSWCEVVLPQYAGSLTATGQLPLTPKQMQ